MLIDLQAMHFASAAVSIGNSHKNFHQVHQESFSMCGILLSEDALNETTVEYIKTRGMSVFNQIEYNGLHMASSVLAIRSYVPQPVGGGDFVFQFNGEIYSNCQSDTNLLKQIIENASVDSVHGINANISSDEDIDSHFVFIEDVYLQINRYENEMALAIVRNKKIHFFKDDIGKRSLGISSNPFTLSSVCYDTELDSMKLYIYDAEDKVLYSRFKPRAGIVQLYFNRIRIVEDFINSQQYSKEYKHLVGYDGSGPVDGKINQNLSNDDACSVEYDILAGSGPVDGKINQNLSNDDACSVEYDILAGSGPVIKLKSMIIESVMTRMCDSDPIVLFSGGIDSLIIAIFVHLCANPRLKIYLINASFPGSFDRSMGQLAYDDLKMKFPEREFVYISVDLTVESVKQKASRIKQLMYPKATTMAFNICIVLYFSAVKASELGNIVYLGAGADELFGGYNKYKKDSFRDHMFFDLFTISSHNICRDDRVIGDNNLEARLPFLDRRIIEFSLQLSEYYLIRDDGKTNKAILRDLLKNLGFERASVVPKKAMQYGAGISRYEALFDQ